MNYAALAVAVLALVIALLARAAASTARAEAEEAKAEAQRRAENAAEETAQQLAATRRLLAAVAGGAKLEREQIIEGRLWRDVGPQEAAKLVADGAVRVLDVRTPQETALGIIPGAQLVPVQELEQRLREVEKRGKPLLVYCAAGARSAAACEMLCAQGYEDVLDLSSGFPSWTGPRAKP